VDFFTFIIIAAFIYSFFAKKDKPPQRRPRSPEDQPRTPLRGNIFENLERQIRESAERFDQERHAGRGEKSISAPVEPAPHPTFRGKTESSPGADTSDADIRKTLARQNSAGIEGAGDEEGTWGTEGREYAQRQEKAVMFEQTGIQSKPDDFQETTAGSLIFSPSEIMQGMIWAEVLKEPRGKRALSRR